ncbi:hypothetical protein [Thalassolituus sp.]|jgi:Tfp pilus assembly protein PilN|uniref:hypothetical protein n=1 Tax=Thalassolituus sp. TaxID=2030822 RepID=UPI0035176F16
MNWQVKQRINFYLEEFQPPRIPSDLERLIIGVAVHAVLFVIVLFGLMINFYYQGHRLDGMTLRQAEVEQQVANIERERPPLSLDEALVSERDRARRNLESSQKILRFLTQQDLRSSHSFTTMVSQLGEQDVRGVWLQRFAFYEEGKQINIEGFTDDPAKVSRYVSSLLGRSGYRNHAFRFVDVHKTEGKPWLSFRLDTRPTDKNSAQPAAQVTTSAEIMRRAREGRI